MPTTTFCLYSCKLAYVEPLNLLSSLTSHCACTALQAQVTISEPTSHT